MIETEKFSITMTLSRSLIEKIDKLKGDKSRSEYVEEIIARTSSEELEDIFKGTTSTSLHLSYESIEKVKEMAKHFNVKPGRVIHMIMLNHICTHTSPSTPLRSDESPADLPLKKGEENG